MILVGDGGIRSSTASTTSMSRARVGVAGIALGARHRHLRTVGEHFGRISASDHGGNAELARDDRRMSRCARRGR